MEKITLKWFDGCPKYSVQVRAIRKDRIVIETDKGLIVLTKKQYERVKRDKSIKISQLFELKV